MEESDEREKREVIKKGEGPQTGESRLKTRSLPVAVRRRRVLLMLEMT
jgi:hypothetical protein